MESENDNDVSTTSISQPGGLLSVLKQNMDEHLSEREVGNSFDNNEDVEQNKENKLRMSDSPTSTLYKLEHCNSKTKEETTCHERDSSQKLAHSPKKLQTQGVLTNHSLNISDAQNGESVETSLGERFGYNRSQKTAKRDDNTSEQLREKTITKDCSASRAVEVIYIDSGYMSDTEMSTDGDTPTPTQSVVARLSPPSSGGNLSLIQGSAVGSKVRF